MNCMKCGREIGEEQVFCEDCLAEMSLHPVKPGTVVLLPQQTKQPPKKATQKKKHVPTPEEQVIRLKKQLLLLRILALILVLIAGALAYVTSRVITELDIQRLLGQNYSTVETKDTTEPPTETDTTPST